MARPLWGKQLYFPGTSYKPSKSLWLTHIATRDLCGGSCHPGLHIWGVCGKREWKISKHFSIYLHPPAGLRLRSWWCFSLKSRLVSIPDPSPRCPKIPHFCSCSEFSLSERFTSVFTTEIFKIRSSSVFREFIDSKAWCWETKYLNELFRCVAKGY